jgi:hypothetical protein
MGELPAQQQTVQCRRSPAAERTVYLETVWVHGVNGAAVLQHVPNHPCTVYSSLLQTGKLPAQLQTVQGRHSHALVAAAHLRTVWVLGVHGAAAAQRAPKAQHLMCSSQLLMVAQCAL